LGRTIPVCGPFIGWVDVVEHCESPWVIMHLAKVSGIPLIEIANLSKYKDNPSFQKYIHQS